MNAHARGGLAVLLLAALVPLADARVSCWTNKEGIRECGDAVPPEYAQKETRTVDQHGVTISVQPRAKTPEELEAERQQREAEQKRKEEEARRQAEQAAYDHYLTSTFSREEEIVAARDRKVTIIEGNVRIARAAMEDSEKKLQELRRQAAAAERSGQPIPTQVAEDMKRHRDIIAEKQAYVAAREKEIAGVREEYRIALERYRELKK